MQLEPERLVKILEVLRELPVPNYRCVRPPTPSRRPHTAQVCCPPGAGSQAPALLLPCVTPAPWCPLYRTLEFLMRHLVHMASFSAQTNMHSRNLAIVWAPNLLRWAVCGQPGGPGRAWPPGGGPGRAVAVWGPWRRQWESPGAQ